MSKRVLIVGGAGVFGSRLAEGLSATTDAQIIIAGRSLERAAEAAMNLGTTEIIALDRETATPADIRATRAELVIDAAGPFQGANLAFARAVIEAGAHYLDLADARDFVAAFPQLDDLARAHNVAAVTGASSTPALTHAALDELCAGWRRIDIVRAGIAPANKMERGLAVMRAILSWAGAPARVFEDGAWRVRSGWSDCGVLDVPGLGRRRFALAETPDLDLIPARYAPRDSALFMAGLELWPMQRGMEMIAALRRWGVLREPRRWAKALLFAGNLLAPFGTDRGGMIVEVFGRDGEDRPAYARWSMLAKDGKGPYTPTFAALALARRFIAGDIPPAGASACVALLRLADFAPEFERHGFETGIEITPLHSPFKTALGGDFLNAPQAVRAAHQAGPVTRLRGEASIARPSSPLAALVARLFGMPRASAAQNVRVTKRLSPKGEVWTRQFGDRRMRSRLRAVAPGVVRESFGPFSFDMRVSANAEALSMSVIGWRIGAVPLPHWLAPRSTATEAVDEEGRFRFDVPIALPMIGRLTHYSGWLVPEELEATAAPVEEEAA
jgi:saccharopine dehydrogenase-like NADP-dependent oxidoreductase